MSVRNNAEGTADPDPLFPAVGMDSRAEEIDHCCKLQENPPRSTYRARPNQSEIAELWQEARVSPFIRRLVA
jgi:hypothetical protein